MTSVSAVVGCAISIWIVQSTVRMVVLVQTRLDAVTVLLGSIKTAPERIPTLSVIDIVVSKTVDHDNNVGAVMLPVGKRLS